MEALRDFHGVEFVQANLIRLKQFEMFDGKFFCAIIDDSSVNSTPWSWLTARPRLYVLYKIDFEWFFSTANVVADSADPK